MKLFKKPKWIRTELDDPLYYLHVLILVLGVYLTVSWFIEPMEITYWNVFLGVLLVTFWDTLAHTILKMD